MYRTLADMTPEEQDLCVGRWATVPTERRLVIIWDVVDDSVWYLSHTSWNEIMQTDLDQITPRLDLPRAWTPSGEPVPGEWEEKIYQDGIGDYIRFTRQRRYITDWEVPHEPR